MNYKEYAENVVNGRIVAGELMKLSCKRFLSDLKRREFFFNEKKVEFLFRFFSIFKHYTGSASGKPFILEPWQKFILANLYGFYRRDTRKRRFTSGYIEMARKNGKTAFSSILCLFNLIADGEDGAEVLLAANSKDQANIAFEMCSKFAHQLDPTDKQIKPYRNEIKFFKTSSKLKVLAADDSKLDGFNASFGLIDEYHAAPNSKVRDVIKSSMGMRSQPMLITITTAGFNLEGPCKKMRDTGSEVLRGILQDDSTFYAIYSIDDEDDWMDEDVWIKSNPNLGVTVTSEFIRDQVQSAKNNPSEEVGVRTKNINQWVQSSDVWIADDPVLRVSEKIDDSVFINEDEPEVYVGTDLASTGDLTAVTYLTEKDGIFYFKTKYQLPESALSAKYNKVFYRDWKRQGYLKVTPGNVCDYDYITNDILGYYNKEMRIIKVGYDPWNSSQWVIRMTEEGMPMEPVSQTMVNLSAPTKLLERLILSGRCRIDDNPITRWCFQNVVLKSDWNDNVRPTKDSYSKKIDGVVSMIMALQQWIKTPHLTGSIDII